MEMLAGLVEETDLAQVACGVKHLQSVLVSVEVAISINIHAPFLTEYTCTSLHPISNGAISYSFNGTSPYRYGASATYSCNEGFYISERSVRTCTGSGTAGFWDGIEPECLGMIIKHS